MFEIVGRELAEFRQTSEQKSCSYAVSAVKLVPRKVFFATGVGKHSDALVSFELALRNAGIERFNLVPVSSILPPGCEIVSAEEGLKELFPGQIVFCVMSRMTSNERGRKIFASVGVAIPPNPELNGYLTEYHGYSDGYEGKHAEENAAYMLKTSFGIEPAKTFNVTVSAEVEDYTTVVAAAVFVI
uniref:Pyruvoyl-dependent arginine decarboxylase n=1 Tax=Geoglobus ahangari TaxID=113653 RepID=A0A7C4W3D9_9EURY